MGPERRKDSSGGSEDFKLQLLLQLGKIEGTCDSMKKDIIHLSERVEHANGNTKAFKILIDEDIQDLKTAIQGDEGKNIMGLAQKIGAFTKEFADHCVQDRWAQGAMITILLAILGTYLSAYWKMFH